MLKVWSKETEIKRPWRKWHNRATSGTRRTLNQLRVSMNTQREKVGQEHDILAEVNSAAITKIVNTGGNNGGQQGKRESSK